VVSKVIPVLIMLTETWELGRLLTVGGKKMTLTLTPILREQDVPNRNTLQAGGVLKLQSGLERHW
jgi:hypothetical protein